MQLLEGIDSRLIGGVVFIFGLMIGSFLNVVIYRLPAGKSIVWPGSACPKCQHELGPMENLPVLSWIFLGAKCKNCKLPISWRYPAIELATGCLFLATFMTFGLTLQTACLLVLLGLMIVTFWIDFDHGVVFDMITLSGVVLGLLYSWLVTGQLLLAVSGAMAGVAALLVINSVALLWLHQDGMGEGDMTLIAMIGAWLGPSNALLSLALGTVAGAVYAIAVMYGRSVVAKQWRPLAMAGALGTAFFVLYRAILMGGPVTPASTMTADFLIAGMSIFMGLSIGVLYMLRRDGEHPSMAFGPALVLGAVLAMFWGDPLVAWCLESYGLRPSLM